jgi:hypothetical protein
VALVGSAKYNEYLMYVQTRGWIGAPQFVSEVQRVAIWSYTSPDGWYVRINQELWHGAPSSVVGGFTSVLNGALSRMYNHPGTVFRGYSEADLDFFLGDYEVGNIREFLGFTSTTKKQELAFYGNVLFIVQARTAPCQDRFPDVEQFSAIPDEKEVLFPTGTRFKVTAVERLEESAIIELEQVT